MRLEIKRIGQVTKGERVIGIKSSIKVVKNKLAPPYRKCEVEINL